MWLAHQECSAGRDWSCDVEEAEIGDFQAYGRGFRVRFWVVMVFPYPFLPF